MAGRSIQPLWRQDHTLATAMRDSVVWYFQEIAKRLGPEREREYFDAVRVREQRPLERPDELLARRLARGVARRADALSAEAVRRTPAGQPSGHQMRFARFFGSPRAPSSMRRESIHLADSGPKARCSARRPEAALRASASRFGGSSATSSAGHGRGSSSATSWAATRRRRWPRPNRPRGRFRKRTFCADGNCGCADRDPSHRR